MGIPQPAFRNSDWPLHKALAVVGNSSMISLKLYTLILFSIICGKAISQTDTNRIVGKWQARKEYSSDSTYNANFTNKQKYQFVFKSNGLYTFNRTVTENGKTIKYLTTGKWTINEISNTLVLYERKPLPARPNGTMADIEYIITMLSKDQLSLFGNFSIMSEGGLGTWEFHRIK